MSKDLALQLHVVQRQLNVPKTRYNQFARYHYRNAEDILEAVKKILPAGHTICLTDEIVQFGDRIYVKASAIFSDGTSEIRTQAFAREPLEKKGSDGSQITGGCSTYARRYAMAGLFAIDDGEDTDNHDNTEEPKKSASKPQSKLPDSLTWLTEKVTNYYERNDMLGAVDCWKSLSANEREAVKPKLSKECSAWYRQVLKNAPKAKPTAVDYASV